MLQHARGERCFFVLCLRKRAGAVPEREVIYIARVIQHYGREAGARHPGGDGGEASHATAPPGVCNRHARARALTGVPDLGRTRSRPLPLLVALPTCQEGVTLQYGYFCPTPASV